MSLRLDPERPVAFAALAVLGLAIGAWLLSGVAAVDPGQPSYKSGAVVRLEAAVPEIAEFAKFNVNDLNPFVPLQERKSELSARNPPKNVKPIPHPDPPTVVRQPPHDPPRVPDPPHPPWAPAHVTAGVANAPECIGLLASDGQEVLIVVGAGDTVVSNITVGTTIGAWKLIAIENGNQARFVDPDGIEQVFPIGSGDLASGGPAANPSSPVITNVPKPAPAPKGVPPLTKQPVPPGGVPPRKRPGLPPRPKTP